MLSTITLIPFVIIVFLVVWDIRKSRKQKPAIDALLMELSAKEQNIIKTYRRQIAEEAAEDDKIQEISKLQIAGEKARPVPTIPKCWVSEPPYLNFKR